MNEKFCEPKNLIVGNLEKAFGHYLHTQKRYNLYTSEKALITPKHDILSKLLAKTRQHPAYEKRYILDLASFSTVEEIEEARELDFIFAGDAVRKRRSPRLEYEPVLALDCEMIQTASDNMALARLSAVNVLGETVLDLLILPCHHSFIEDCRTHITGLDVQELRDKGVSFETARRIFASVVHSNTVLVGHALEHDIYALKLRHDKIIDTALLYPVIDITGRINEDLSHGLDYLTERVLKRQMDRGKRSGVHDSIEDAKNSLDLVKYLISLESKEINIEPIPQRVRPKRYFRGSNYGVAASLRSIRDYSLKISVNGANEASNISAELERTRHGMKRKRIDSVSLSVESRSMVGTKLSKTGSNLSAKLAMAAKRLERKVQAKRRISALKFTASRFSRHLKSK